jgi:hypothetical protein
MKSVALDLGGSGLRAVFEDDGIICRIQETSRFAKIAASSRVIREIKDLTSDFAIESPSLPELNGRYVRGEAANYYDGEVSFVDNTKFKIHQTPTFINAVYLLARTCLNAKRFDSHIEKIGIVIPAREYYSEHADLFKKKLSGVHYVRFPLLDREITVRIDAKNISIGPEGAVTVFDLRRNLKYKDIISSGVGVVVDVGFRSTDIMAFNRFKIVAKGVRSFLHGGITIDSQLAAELESINKGVSSEQISEVLRTGVASNVAVGPIIEKIRTNFAATLRSNILAVLAHSELNMSSLNYIVPVGRPFMINEDIDPGTKKFAYSLGQALVSHLPDSVKLLEVENLEYANVEALYRMLAG